MKADRSREHSVEKKKKLGVNPYPAKEYEVNTSTSKILNDFETNPEQFKQIKIAGRIMSRRIMGKASFAEIQDSFGKIQIYVNRDEIAPSEDKTLYNEIFKKHLDIGDFIGVEGFVFKTKVGETSIHVLKLEVLSKSLKPLPIVKTDKDGKAHDAFTDAEQRYRQRYVDLIVNPKVKETFIKRTKVINSMREFFNKEGYLEVEMVMFRK